MARSERSHAHYYAGTNGQRTVWRRTLRPVIYLSATIPEFGPVQFHQSARSGPNSYPVEQIGVEEYEALRKARFQTTGITGDHESWIDNADLPKDLVLPLPPHPFAILDDELEEPQEMFRDLVAT